MTIPYWDFMGSTMVTNNYIRITPDLQSKQGALWNSIVSTFPTSSILLCTCYIKNKFIIYLCLLYIQMYMYYILNKIFKLIMFVAMSCTKLGIAS